MGEEFALYLIQELTPEILVSQSFSKPSLSILIEVNIAARSLVTGSEANDIARFNPVPGVENVLNQYLLIK